MSKGEREQTNEAYKHGRIAQLVEYLPYKEGVTGSSPVSPTTKKLGATSICGSAIS